MDKEREPRDKEQLQQQLSDTKTKFAATKTLLAEPTPQPLTCLRRTTQGPDGEAIGSYTMNPKELDQMVIDAWAEIYKGNAEDHDQLVQDFLIQYDKFLPKHEAFTLEAIDPMRLKQVCQHANKSVPGLDQWSPAEYTLLSDQAFVSLARLLDCIEDGAPWPEQLCFAKAALLPMGVETRGIMEVQLRGKLCFSEPRHDLTCPLLSCHQLSVS